MRHPTQGSVNLYSKLALPRGKVRVRQMIDGEMLSESTGRRLLSPGRRASEGVTGGRVARLQAAAQPRHPLLR
jgi:hypothetical protein